MIAACRETLRSTCASLLADLLPAPRVTLGGATAASIAIALGYLAPPARAVEGGVIAGTVTAASTQAPIDGVEVCADSAPWHCVKTNAGGEYSVSVETDGKYDLIYTAPADSGYVTKTYYHGKFYLSEADTVSVSGGATVAGVDQQLQEGAQIGGTAINQLTQQPVGSVEVCARSVVTENYSSGCVMTNALGEYTISGLPGGEYYIEFGFGYGGGLGEVYVTPEFYNGRLFVSSLYQQADKVSVPMGGAVSGIDSELKEYSHITGRVVSAITKAPIAGIFVKAYSWSGSSVGSSATTDANGEYTISHLADSKQEYYLDFEVPLNSGMNYYSQYYGGKSVAAPGEPVYVAYGKTASSVDAELEEGGAITGTVISAATKAPVANINVCAYGISSKEYTCSWSQSDGTYSIILLTTGEYRVSFGSFNHNYYIQYYDGKAIEAEANLFAVAQGKVTSGIDAELQSQPPLELTWIGEHNDLFNWSTEADWQGDVAPSDETVIGNLVFPAVSSATCSYSCYRSYNDRQGLSVRAINIDDAKNYEIGGEPFTLEGGGLATSPDGSSGQSALAVLETPIVLGSSQTWHIAGLGSEHVGENGLLTTGGITGPGSELTLDMSAGGALFLGGNQEVGAVSVAGQDTSQVGLGNGIVGLLGGNLGGSSPLTLSHVLFGGSGTVGALDSAGSEVDPITIPGQGGLLDTASATFDANSDLELQITDSGPNAGTDYSQLFSRGPIALGGAALHVYVAPPSEGQPCPKLWPGQTYTLVSTTGALSGEFGDAPQGSEIPIEFPTTCPPVSQFLKVAYYRSGSPQTVTGTLMPGPSSQTTLSPVPPVSVTNQQVTLSAEVSASTGAPAGTVEFLENKTRIPGCAERPLQVSGSSYTATCQATYGASASPVRVTAVFTPERGLNLKGSASAPSELIIARAATTTALQASGLSTSLGSSITYAASVSAQYGGRYTPRGELEFLDGGTPIPGCTSQPVNSGQPATCQPIFLVADTHTITARYVGDANFAGSTSAPLSLRIPPAPASIGLEAGAPPASPMGASPASATPSRASLRGSTIPVSIGGVATLQLRCEGSTPCAGKLALQIRGAGGPRRRRSAAATIGLAPYAIQPGHTGEVTIRLDHRGTLLVRSRHRGVRGQLLIVPKTGPVEVVGIRLMQRRPSRRRRA